MYSLYIYGAMRAVVRSDEVGGHPCPALPSPATPPDSGQPCLVMVQTARPQAVGTRLPHHCSLSLLRQRPVPAVRELTFLESL